MNQTTSLNAWLGWVVMMACVAGTLAVPAPAWAQRDPSARRSAYRYSYTVPRNDEIVRRAFRDVVAPASSSMVRVLCDNRPVALGVVVDPEGYVLTKSSQLHGQIQCHLFDGRRLPAEVVGSDSDHDVAMLKIEPGTRPLAAVRWSSTSDSELGSWLATPGLGALPISVGVVSAQTRQIESGRGLLGILMGQGDRGPSVDQVIPGSGAAQAGLKVADVIVRVNGRDVATPDSLQDAIRRFKPGDRVSLVVVRSGQELSLTAVLRTLSQIQNQDKSTVSVDGPISERASGFPLAMQHDSVIDPSDCGGVVVNLDGEAVGLNIARADRVSTYAIPASALLPLIDRLKSSKLADNVRQVAR